MQVEVVIEVRTMSMLYDVYELVFYPTRIKERREKMRRKMDEAYQDFIQRSALLANEVDRNIKLTSILNNLLRTNAIILKAEHRNRNVERDRDRDS